MPRILMTGAAGGIGTSLAQIAAADLSGSAVERPEAAGRSRPQRKIQGGRTVRPRAGRGDLRGRRRHPAFRRLLGRRPLGHHPAVQHHRLLQSVRGGAQTGRQARGVRLVEPCGRLLSAPSPYRHRCARRGPTAATASARCSARRSARSMPTSTASASPACGSAISATSRWITAGCRSGSSRKIWCSCAGSGSIIPTSISRYFTARPTTSASWWDNHRAYDLGYRPTGRAEDFREHAMAEQAKLPPDPVGDFYQGGAFCGMEFDGDTNRIVDWK